MEDRREAETLETAEAWFTHQRYKGYSPKTIKRRRFTMRQWDSATQGAWDNRTPQHVEHFLLQWPQPGTRRAILGDLRSFYRFAVQRGYLEVDPTLTVETPRQRRRRPSPVRPDQVRLLLAHTVPPRRTMVALAALAGLRVSEVAAMSADQIDLDGGTLAVRDGKWRKDRFIPIGPRLRRELEGWPPGLLFPGVSPDGVSYRIKSEMRRLGVPGRPHDLRAGFATELARVSGGNLVLVAAMLGHESVQTTQAYVSYSQDASALVAAMYAA